MTVKPITQGSGRVAYAIDRLSKNTLADIVLDRVHAEIGEGASDEQIMAHLQGWLETIARVRGDKAPDLVGLLTRPDRAEAKRHERQQQAQERAAAVDAQQRRLCEQIDEINRQKLKMPIRGGDR
jgi:cupin superfamily acireductone dioxygenase involved in methionine salvage